MHRYRGIPVNASRAVKSTSIKTFMGDVPVESGEWILQYRNTRVRFVVTNDEFREYAELMEDTDNDVKVPGDRGSSQRLSPNNGKDIDISARQVR